MRRDSRARKKPQTAEVGRALEHKVLPGLSRRQGPDARARAPRPLESSGGQPVLRSLPQLEVHDHSVPKSQLVLLTFLG